ncbi:hypothetical protein BKA82DRAFT_4019058 [Pisolithus tinctorius]|nr:hypothetical protein BKA82DRAFT_4019058 [Pisolithus tinctorius]
MEGILTADSVNGMVKAVEIPNVVVEIDGMAGLLSCMEANCSAGQVWDRLTNNQHVSYTPLGMADAESHWLDMAVASDFQNPLELAMSSPSFAKNEATLNDMGRLMFMGIESSRIIVTVPTFRGTGKTQEWMRQATGGLQCTDHDGTLGEDHGNPRPITICWMLWLAWIQRWHVLGSQNTGLSWSNWPMTWRGFRRAWKILLSGAAAEGWGGAVRVISDWWGHNQQCPRKDQRSPDDEETGEEGPLMMLMNLVDGSRTSEEMWQNDGTRLG